MNSKRPVRLGILIDSFKIGGAELQTIQFLENINRDQFKPFVYTLRKPGPLSDRIKKQNIELIPLNARKYNLICCIKRFYHLLRYYKIDVLYCVLHNPIVFGSITGRLAGIRHIIGGIRGLGMTWKKKEIWSLRLFQPLIELFIVNSDAIKKAHSSREWIRPEKIRTVPNGLNTSLFSYAEEKENIIGIVGSLKPIKGQRQFLKAAKIIIRQGLDFSFMIIGDGPDLLALKKLSKELEIRDKVIFTGQVNNVYDYIKRFKMLISASSFEGFSNVILEAMSSGTPVIASDVPSNNEFIINEENGLLFKFGKETDLASKIVYLDEHPILYKSIQINARKKVEHSFSLSKMVNSMQKQFLSLLS